MQEPLSVRENYHKRGSSRSTIEAEKQQIQAARAAWNSRKKEKGGKEMKGTREKRRLLRQNSTVQYCSKLK